jgi:hypothetical protein
VDNRAWRSEIGELDAQLNRATVRWQVEEPPFIAAVHPPRSLAAIGTFARHGAASSDDEDAVRSITTSSINRPAGDNDRNDPCTMDRHPYQAHPPNLAYLHRK